MNFRLRVYDILTEEGKTLGEIVLSMPTDFEWVDVFNELEKIVAEPLKSYSYEIVE